ncbi:MAG: trypsin-like peptidase domain-containing protein, partial [Clostridia bacterium]|nr:trypsin-like peptidase domain-containing protein [Clostridia bacterium]
MKRRLLWIIVVAALALALSIALVACGESKQNKLSATQIYATVDPSIICVVAGGSSSISTGTGFFIDTEGTFVTNYHVIEGADTIAVALQNDEKTPDGRRWRVTTVVGIDIERDIAILKIDKTGTTPVRLS